MGSRARFGVGFEPSSLIGRGLIPPVHTKKDASRRRMRLYVEPRRGWTHTREPQILYLLFMDGVGHQSFSGAAMPPGATGGGGGLLWAPPPLSLDPDG